MCQDWALDSRPPHVRDAIVELRIQRTYISSKCARSHCKSTDRARIAQQVNSAASAAHAVAQTRHFIRATDWLIGVMSYRHTGRAFRVFVCVCKVIDAARSQWTHTNTHTNWFLVYDYIMICMIITYELRDLQCKWMVWRWIENGWYIQWYIVWWF